MGGDRGGEAGGLPVGSSGPSLRQRHPGCVPVVCLGEGGAPPGAGGRPLLKLVVPDRYTVSQLKREIERRAPGAPVDMLWIGRELAQDGSALVSALDERHRAEDGCLYAQLGSPCAIGATGAAAPPECLSQEAACGGFAFFHLPDRDLEVEAGCGDPSWGDAGAQGDADVAARLREKHPGRVPVVCRQAPKPGLPGINTKLLVPRTMACRQVKSFLYKRLDSPGMTADGWGRTNLFADGVQLHPEDHISAVFEKHLGEDGLLHLAYGADAAEALAQTAAADAAAEACGQGTAGEHGLAHELEQVKAEALVAVEQAFQEGRQDGLARAAEEARRADAAAASLRERERQLAEIAAALRPLAPHAGGGACGPDGDALVELVRSAVDELLGGRADANARAAGLERSLREALARAEAAERRAAAPPAGARAAGGAGRAGYPAGPAPVA